MDNKELEALWNKANETDKMIHEIQVEQALSSERNKALTSKLDTYMEKCENGNQQLLEKLDAYDKKVSKIVEHQNKSAGAKEALRWTLPCLISFGMLTIAIITIVNTLQS